MAATQNNRIHDGLVRLVEHFLSEHDDDSVNQTLEVCKRILEKYVISFLMISFVCFRLTGLLERVGMLNLLGMSNILTNS